VNAENLDVPREFGDIYPSPPGFPGHVLLLTARGILSRQI
jgi:hypothetical protein